MNPNNRTNIVIPLIQNGFLPSNVEVNVRQLSGGFWSEVFHLDGQNVDWIVKLSQQGESEGLHPVLPSEEIGALEALKNLRIAPNPIGFFKVEAQKFILIYEYIRGQTWDRDVSNVARKLSFLHELRLDSFQNFRKLVFTPEDVLRHADSFLLNTPVDTLSRQLKQLRPSLVNVNLPKELSLVHGDIHPSNIIVNKDGIRLIDWQSPGIGDPVQDLHAFVSPMFKTKPFSANEIQLFLDTYDNDCVRQRLQLMSPFYAFRIAAHCLLRRNYLKESRPAISARYENHCLTAMSNLS